MRNPKHFARPTKTIGWPKASPQAKLSLEPRVFREGKRSARQSGGRCNA
jgi:hypothetical protein